MIKEISPSSLPKLAECALYVSAPGASPAAERGTLLDKALRELFMDDPTTFDTLEPADKAAVEWGANELRALSGGYHVETREEHLGMEVPGLSKPGTADAVCVRAKWVADVKTGQVRNYRKQLAAYALACMEEHFAQSWTAHVLYVDQRLRRTYDFTREQAEATVAATIAEATDPQAKPTPCEFCTWCANFNSCTAIVRQSTEALALVKGERTLDEIRAEIAADPLALSVFAANWKAADKHLAEPLIDTLRTRLTEGEEIPGWKLTKPTTRRYVEPADFMPVIHRMTPEQAFYAGGGKISADTFVEAALSLGIDSPEQLVKSAPGTQQMRQTKH